MVSPTWNCIQVMLRNYLVIETHAHMKKHTHTDRSATTKLVCWFIRSHENDNFYLLFGVCSFHDSGFYVVPGRWLVISPKTNFAIFACNIFCCFVSTRLILFLCLLPVSLLYHFCCCSLQVIVCCLRMMFRYFSWWRIVFEYKL